jgi:hypothetical protein
VTDTRGMSNFRLVNFLWEANQQNFGYIYSVFKLIFYENSYEPLKQGMLNLAWRQAVHLSTRYIYPIVQIQLQTCYGVNFIR